MDQPSNPAAPQGAPVPSPPPSNPPGHSTPSGTSAGQPAHPAHPDLSALVFDAAGLIPAIAQQHDTGEVLMLAWMDAEAVRRTLATGRATYWSRSRQEYWVKGETSGHAQRVVSVALDCDGDALLLQVDQTGPACHTGARTCFHTPLTATSGEDRA
ncbi:phosphoribosyl-AMP cyclohydrolase [Longispora albida]|uniref:phosphoribosyl-AMP cyclohydrolase n=1 Tax=Longispora albida TaxID=203523 RepID=UPI00037B1FA6|nr:phosphoribosyl-AMP cyclohydrolase [Longispora albida]